MFCALFLFSPSANATKVYAVNEDFTTAPTSNWGFVAASGHTFGYDAVNKRFTIRWGSPTSYTTKTLASAVTPGSDNKVTIEVILQFYTSGNSSSSGNLYFLDENGNAITGIWFGRTSSQWRIANTTNYPGAVAPTATATYTNVLASNAPIAKVTAVLNFSTHTMDYTAQVGTFDNTTRVFTATTPSVSATAQAFINTSASNVKSLLSNFYRVSTTTGTNGYDLMYFGISTEQTVSTVPVTVKFKDQDNNYFKTEEIVTEQVVGSTYNATLAQKANVNTGGFNYVLDPSSTTSVVVTEGGSTLELSFRKAPIYSDMVWNGTTDTNGDLWSEWYTNFLNGTNATNYQTDASATFDATALNKAVVLNDPINIGAGNILINSTGYSFTGGGALTGTGAMNINLTGTDVINLGIINNSSGTTQISGGTVTLSKTGGLASNVTVSGATTLIPTAGATFPSTTFNASSTINCDAIQTSMANISASSGAKLTVNSSYSGTASDGGYTSFGFGAAGTLSTGSELEFNSTGTIGRMGMLAASSTYLANTKVALKGSSFLFINAGQGAPTTINVGTLSGETGTSIGWGRTTDLTRTITWSVGALNENSEFAGSITNTGGYATSGSSYIGNFTNFEKVGTGILTLSGTSTHNGSIAVKAGTLNVTGTLGANVPVTVDANGTLEGTGTINGTVIVNGTLKGNLNVGVLTLADSTIMNVNGFNVGEFDQIDVTGALTNGGVLVINVANDPSGSGEIQLINAGSYTGTFTNVKVISPSNPANAPKRAPNKTSATTYTYDAATGKLSYAPSTPTGLNNVNTNVQIYPTLTKGNVFVKADDVNSINVVGLNGQMIKNIKSTGNETIVNLYGLNNGTYLLNVKFNNGTTSSQQVILQK